MFQFIYKLPLGVIGILLFTIGLIWAEAELCLCSYCKNATKWKIFNISLCVLSIITIAYATFLNRSADHMSIRLIPFYSFTLAKENPEMYRTMIMNALLFLPLGLSFISSLPKRINSLIRFVISVIFCIALSVTIEVIQYRFKLGVCEIDDVICNTFGGFMGSVTVFWKLLIQKIRSHHICNVMIFRYFKTTFAIAWITWCILAVVKSPEYNFNFAKYITAPIYIIGGFAPFLSLTVILKNKHLAQKSWNLFTEGTKSLTLYIFLLVILEIVLFVVSSTYNSNMLPYLYTPVILFQGILYFVSSEKLIFEGRFESITINKTPFIIIMAGVLWAILHLPLWFVYGSSHQSINFMTFIVISVILSFWIFCLYKKTKNISSCALFYGLTNALFSIFIIDSDIVLIIGITILALITCCIPQQSH